MPVQNHKGFTLLELMIAMSIFALISLLTMGGLSNALNTRAHTEEKLQRLTQMQMVFTILSREVQQHANRTIRDEYGAILEPFSAETGDGIIGLEFTHQGRFTFGDQISLQRVAYYQEDDKLIKKVWKVLDRVEDTKAVKQIVLEQVDSVTFSFFNSESSSEDGWEDSLPSAEEGQTGGIKLTLISKEFGEIQKIFAVMP